MIVQLYVRGNPLKGRSECRAYLGKSPYEDAGAWGVGIQTEGASPEAIRAWNSSAIGDALKVLLPNLDPRNEGSRARRSEELKSLENIIAESALLGMRMLVEWIRNHPDPNVRILAVRILTDQGKGPTFDPTDV